MCASHKPNLSDHLKKQLQHPLQMLHTIVFSMWMGWRMDWAGGQHLGPDGIGRVRGAPRDERNDYSDAIDDAVDESGS